MSAPGDDGVALFRAFPALRARVPWVTLGDWPTPIAPAALAGDPVWIKHEGRSHARYGGNKLRTLEAWFGHAVERGAARIWAIGAYGSNHAVATVTHAATAGLDAGAILFPQPYTPWAAENAGALVASGCPIEHLRSVIEVPFAGGRVVRRDRRAGRRAIVMPPGGATPIGTLGALSAAFELAEQLRAGDAPWPARIVLAAGSTCTTAGLLAGTALAARLGIWHHGTPPIVHAVRVTPWPVTSRLRIAALAAQTLARIAALGGPRVAGELGVRPLYAQLIVDGRELGDGYGRPTPGGAHAAALFGGGEHRTKDRTEENAGDRDATRPRLDAVYAAKAAAALVRLARAGVGPLLFWASKSVAILAAPDERALAAAPPALVRWLHARA